MEIGGNIFERDSERDVKILPPLFSSKFSYNVSLLVALFFQLIEVDSISEPKRVAFISTSSFFLSVSSIECAAEESSEKAIRLGVNSNS